MLDWICSEIKRISYILDHDLFLSSTLREKLMADLSRVTEMKKKHDQHEEKMAAEARSNLKDPNR